MDDISILRQTSLFSGIDPPDLTALLAALRPIRRSFGRDELLLVYGQPCTSLGVLLSGRLEAWRPLPDGTPIPMAQLGPGDIFADVLGGTGLNSPITVQAAAPSEVLLFSYDLLLAPCDSCPAAHTLLLRNLVRTTGRKYFSLMDRVELLTLKSLRTKICAYLLLQAAHAGADTFTVPGTRTTLAAYLNCDRSALSRELSHMQADGLIETYKNSFKLVDRPALERLYQLQVKE